MPLTFTPIKDDLSEANEKLKALYDAYNALELKFNSLSNTPPASTGGTSGFPAIITSDDNFIEVRPLNFGGTVGAFTMAVKKFDNVNLPDPRPNDVGSFWGYNTTAGGGQKIAGEASYRFAGETYFDVGGAKVMEIHMPDFFTNSGMNVRTNSTYFNRSTGQAATNMQIVQLNLKKFNNANIDWFKIADENGTTRMTMIPSQTGGSVEMNFDGHSISTSSANSKLRFLTKGIVEFNQPLGGLDGGGFEVQFNANGTGKTFKVVNGNGNITVFEVTKDGIQINGKKIVVDANGFLKVQ